MLFDNGSQVSQITHVFARKAKLTCKEACYSIAGIGNNSTIYNNGKIYEVPLLDSNGTKTIIKAFGVDKILSDKIRRDQVNLND